MYKWGFPRRCLHSISTLVHWLGPPNISIKSQQISHFIQDFMKLYNIWTDNKEASIIKYSLKFSIPQTFINVEKPGSDNIVHTCITSDCITINISLTFKIQTTVPECLGNEVVVMVTFSHWHTFTMANLNYVKNVDFLNCLKIEKYSKYCGFIWSKSCIHLIILEMKEGAS